MKYSETKTHLIDEICELCQNLDTDTLANIMDIAKRKQPISLDAYLKEEFDGYSEETLRELALEIKITWLRTGPGCRENGYLMKTKENVDSWHDVDIEGYMLDTWIAEQDPLFNPITLAQIIFEIYCGRITFRE